MAEEMQASPREAPPPMRGRALSWSGFVMAAMVVAVVLRLGSAVYQGNAMDALPGVYDQISYDGLAERVLGGYGFSFEEDHWPATRGGEPTAHWSYLYTLYLAAVYALFGDQPVVARVIQAVVAGILQTWLTWRIGTRVFGQRVGVVAAGLAAVYVYFVYYAGSLITETFYIVAVLWSLDCLTRFASGRRQVTWALWAELGLAFGVAILLRQLFMLFVPLMTLWLWWLLYQQGDDSDSGDRHRVWQALGGTLLTATVVLALILPWTVRNYRAFGTFVPLNTNSGYAFFWGNHPYHGTRFVPILPDDGPSYLDLIPPELLSLNEAELDSALLARGVGFVLADPRRYLLLSLSRAQEYFKFWPTSESGLISNFARVASFGLLLPFMLYGIWLALRQLRTSSTLATRWSIVLLLGFSAAYILVHLLTWTLIRYRIPVDAVLVIFAASGLVDLGSRISRPREASPADIAPV